ncbi:CAP domain-containing protein [Companilactobacillus tucceti]|uniref:CAP domain-containing protein n=1 Tax=Companilactobacillus tucceti TaxID=238012 RepID=UPI00070B0770|nr:CAP domain-containing protein [Companilactobacillus tucceti]
MKRSRLLISCASLLLLFSVAAPTTVQATSNVTTNISDLYRTYYSPSEITRIKQLQQTYQNLDNDLYNKSNLFTTAPNLTTDGSFYPGTLSGNAINGTVSWINYYRELSGLSPITSKEDSNYTSQIASSVMAVSNSNPYISQHFLANTARPDNIKDIYWHQAVYGTGYGNLYFGYPKTIGDPVRELIFDDTDIEGANTGHRAWLLSPRLSSVGVGIAIGNYGRQYETIFVNNPTDIYNQAEKSVVTYPYNLFPVEELTNKYGALIPWSITFADQNKNIITDQTTITVENLTDGSSGITTPLSDRSYAYLSDVIAYMPPKNIAINDHSTYRVTINNLNSESVPSYSYTFKTFSETANGLGYGYANQ